ncbi:14230_t:CDS:2 [Ambispora leptoticha]|uniref:14230_t:CDS:1 n=1 Tax=Ambispora leptoticha TaxID=144679 RepID=A0A9N9D5I5_9GLOM|nr:14230_t:CDS:2 [Ambispora leptoticha]
MKTSEIRANTKHILFLFTFITFNFFTQTKSNNCTGDIKINTQHDLDILENCNFYSGTIDISETTLTRVIIPHIKTLHGSFNIKNNTKLVEISAFALKSTTNFISVGNLNLTTVSLPKLRITTKSFEIENAPLLKILLFPRGLLEARNFRVKRTGINEIIGLNVVAMNTLELLNNINLDRVSLPKLHSVNLIRIYKNGKSDFTFEAHNLAALGESLFQNIDTLSLPLLKRASSSLTFTENTITRLSIPNLDQILGSLTITLNPQLESISFPSLNHIGGNLMIDNNPRLWIIDQLNELKKVDNKIQLGGNFSKILFKSLKKFLGDLFIQTSTTEITCADFFYLREGGVIVINNVKCEFKVELPDDEHRHEYLIIENDHLWSPFARISNAEISQK